MKTPVSRSLLMFAALGLLLGSASRSQAATFVWNVASPGANNWNIDGNWNATGFPGSADVAIFAATGPSTASNIVNNVVSQDTTVTSLFYTNIVNGQWDVTQIPTGVTLTVTNLKVGFLSNDTAVTLVSMNGGGSLAVFGNPMLVGDSGSTTFPPADSALDLIGLNNFTYNSPTGTNNIGIGNRSAVNWNLASVSNYITAATLNWNQSSSSSGGSGTVKLGLGTNILNANTISMAQSRNNSTLSFYGATGGLRLRGTGGTDADRATLILGNRNQNTSGGSNTGALNLNGHPVDAKFSTVTMGQATPTAPTGTNTGIGIINFDNGTIDVTTILMAISGGNVTNTAVGTINVGTNAALGTSGTLIVGSGGISMANQAAAAGGSTGNLNISGGSAICSGPITKATVAGIGNINITNGTLAASGTVGTLAIPLSALVVSNSTLTLAASSTATNVVVTNLTALAGANNTVNISALPVIPVFPTQLPLIKYTTGSGDLTTLVMGSLPSTFQGYISNNVTASSIDLVITNGPTPPPASKPVVWNGEVSGDWDTTTTNWSNSGNLTNYNNLTLLNAGDPVTFNDTLLGTTNVNLTQALSPASVTVNNTLSNYFFTGTGKISGSAVVTKSGAASLVIANSGGSDFTGGVIVNAGSLIFGNSGANTFGGGATVNGGSLVFANSGLNGFTGGVTINGGTVQFGNGSTAGALPASGAFVDNGSLIFNHSDSFTFSTAITGSGAVSQTGTGTLTLSGASTFTGGLIVNAGAVRANTVNAAGTALVTVNSGGTFVVGAALTNSFALSNAVLGTSLTGGFTMTTNKELTIAANSTNIIYCADPQTPTTSFQFLVDGNLRGSGTVLIINGPTNNPDGGNGVRFRNTNAVSDFSGTIIYTNNNKGEFLTLTPDATTYSPIGTGKLVMYCGAYDGSNATTCPATGGYSELNLRNNGPGTVIIGNDVSLLGTGATIINALAGSNGITLGNLKIGAGQELIGYKAAATLTNVVIFPTVTITGGNATFSPHSSSFGAAAQAGTDFSLGTISEQAAGSGITMGGKGNLTLTGVNTYTGNTAITNGTLFLKGSASIATSPNIILGSGATLDFTNLLSTFALGASQTLSNLSSTATLSGNADATLGTVSLRYASATPSFTVANGALTIASGTAFKVNNTGSALIKGNYKLISAGTGGSVAGTAPSSVTLSGNGTAGAATPSLQITGSELFLVVPNTAPTIARIVTNSTTAGLTWKIAISNLATAAGWGDIDNDALTLTAVGPNSNLGKSVTTDATNIFYNAAVTAEDFFSYTISDGTATANGTVYLEAVNSAPSPANATLIVTGGNGVPTITFAGIPGRTNVVQASTNTIDWVNISTNVAGTNGLWQVTDPDATNFVSRFYRSYQPYP